MGLIFETWTQDVIFVITSLITFALYKIHKTTKYFEKTNIKTIPILKTLSLDLKIITLRINIFDYIEELYRVFPDDKAVGYLSFFRPVMLIRHPKMIEKVLVKDFGYFHDHGIPIDADVNPLESHLFNMAGWKWRALRSRLSPVFSSGKLKNMFGEVERIAEGMTDQVPKGEEILIRDWLSRFAIDVIGSTAFGVDAGALKDPETSEFRKMALKIFRPSKIQIVKGILRGFFPKLTRAFKMKSFEDDVTNFFFSITKQAFDLREKSGTTRGDFVDLLLQLKGKGTIDAEEDEKSKYEVKEEDASQLILTDELLSAQSFIFLVAGWETITTGMMYSVYHIGKNQEIQDKLRNEVNSYETMDYQSIKSMTYLDACILEAMRMNSPGGLLIRACTKEYLMKDDDDEGVVGGGKTLGTIPKGTMLLIPAQSVHKDSKYTHNPDVFDPERFLDEEGKLKHTPVGSFMPFGEGPRICIAQRFAMMEAKVAIALLVKKYKLVISPKTKEPIKLDIKNTLNDIEGGLWIVLEELRE